MPVKISAMLALLLSLTISPLISHAEVIKIGVFSQQNFRTTMKEWGATTDYLNKQLPQHLFQILPYSQQANLITDLEKNKLDFLLTRKANLAQLMTRFSLNPILNAGNNHTQWILSRSQNLPYTLTYSITDALLKQPAAAEAKWLLASNAEVQLSTGQKIKQLYNQLTALGAEIMDQHWTLLGALLLSALLIVLFRKWDQHHRRAADVKKHQQQSNDPSLSDTVF